MNEATLIIGNMSKIAGYHGTTTPDVVDEMTSRFDNQVICNGYLRNIVFTPITDNSIAFKTVPWE